MGKTAPGETTQAERFRVLSVLACIWDFVYPENGPSWSILTHRAEISKYNLVK